MISDMSNQKKCQDKVTFVVWQLMQLMLALTLITDCQPWWGHLPVARGCCTSLLLCCSW